MKLGKRLGKVGPIRVVFQRCLAELICKIISSLGLYSGLLGSSGGSATHAGFLLDVVNFWLVDIGIIGAKGDVILLRCRVGFVVAVVVVVVVVFTVVFKEKDEKKVSFCCELNQTRNKTYLF